MENDKVPILKYFYNTFLCPPMLLSSKTTLRIDAKNCIEIPIGDIPKPYKKHTLENTGVKIATLYTDIQVLLTAIQTLHSFSEKCLVNQDYMYCVHKFIEEQKILTNIVFDKTRIKSLSEKPLIKKDLPVKRILPLIYIDGLFFLTSKRLYFQPIHSIYSKPILSIKIHSLTKLYKRRYKLQHVNQEII